MMEVNQAELEYIIKQIISGLKKELRTTSKKVNEIYVFLFKNGFKARVDEIARITGGLVKKFDQHLEVRDVTCPHGNKILAMNKDVSDMKERHIAEDAVISERDSKRGKSEVRFWRRREDKFRWITTGVSVLMFVTALMTLVGRAWGWW